MGWAEIFQQVKSTFCLLNKENVLRTKSDNDKTLLITNSTRNGMSNKNMIIQENRLMFPKYFTLKD